MRLFKSETIKKEDKLIVLCILLASLYNYNGNTCKYVASSRIRKNRKEEFVAVDNKNLIIKEANIIRIIITLTEMAREALTAITRRNNLA